jgi:hypothetical protein
MKVNLTNEEIFKTVYLLKKNYPDLSKYDKRFNFAISRTLENLLPIASQILKARETGIDKYKEFERVKLSIVKKYAVVDEEGLVQSFNSDEDKEKAQSELDSLIENYKDVIEERQKEIQIYNEILSEEVEVDIIPCSFVALPNDFNFQALRILVKETDEQIEAML